MVKIAITAAALGAFVTPSLAADFYIVQDTATKHCRIVEQKPTSRTTVIVGGDRLYTTREQAEGGMKTVKVCEEGGNVGGPVRER